ncbi:unnamed protein product [Rotaria sordida]|uniref:FLYWCH-type domain-containing protein n=1 Tax=Rotaria sordida TaxID=392033 RepID=A0A813UPH4_9BILA|nr:unnamed protein product [Rotaria sordida]
MIFEDTTTSFTNDFLTDIDMGSLNEVPLQTNSTISEPIQIISTQRGKRKLLLDGYIYRLDRSNDRGIEQWRCSKKSCRGRIHLHNSFLFSSTINRTNVTLVSSHSHASEPAQCEAAIVIDHIRTTAQHNQHESPKDIVHRLLRSVNNETAANLPSITAMQRSIQRRRQQQKSFDSFLINIEHEENLTTNDIQILYRSINDSSLLHINELAYNQILVLTCDNEQSYRNKLANTSIWLCTTFHEIKNDYLQCILIIQVFENNNETLLPLIYALLPSNTNVFYMKLFNELLPLQTPKYILTNFDKILIDSLKNFFHNHTILPDIKICSIFLHYELCKFIQQYIRIIHDMEYKSIKYLLALAYIPQLDVIMAFEALQEIYSSSIEGIYDKFEDLCIGRLRPNGHRSQPLFTTTLWNWTDVVPYFDNLLLINTNIKQWNDMFRTSLLTSSYRSCYKIIRTIQQLYQHQINTKNRKIETNKTNIIIQNYYTNKFRQIIQSYQSLSFEEYLLNLIEYLPI